MRPSVLIADDQRLYAEALSHVLCTAYRVLGIAADGKELAKMAMSYRPDIIVTDISMPVLNGLDAIRDLKKLGLQSKFIILTMYADMSLAVLAFRVGASAFILKTADSAEFLEALSTVERGVCYLSPQISGSLQTVLEEAARRPPVDRGSLLSKHQLQIIRLAKRFEE